jgi:phosphonoacetaldehyde hydrolase
MIDTILFDLAGTTIDCGCCGPVGVFVEVFRRHGVVVTEGVARGPMGTHKREHVRRVMVEIAAEWRAVHGSDPTDADVDALYAQAEPLQVAVLPDHAGLIPGFVDVLGRLRARGLRVGATTGYTAPMVATLAPILAARGWAPDVLVSASDTPAGRPAPYMNWRAATTLGATGASSCVVFGDTEVDMFAARRAGMWAVGVSLTGNEVGLPWDALWALSAEERADRGRVARDRLLAAGAHIVIDSVLDAEPAIDELAARAG